MNLKIASNRLLVLDTKDSDDTYYYGKAYFDGYATVKGPVETLVIEARMENLLKELQLKFQLMIQKQLEMKVIYIFN